MTDTPHTPMYVIVDSSFGDLRVYPAKIEIAKEILKCHIDNVDKDIIRLHESNEKIVIWENVMEVMNKILSGPIGTMASKTIEITEEIKNELIWYCIGKGLSIENHKIKYPTYEFIFGKFKFEDLSFFRDNDFYVGRTIVYQDTADSLHKYSVIKDDKWKETATDLQKINYILDFVNYWSHRDVKYEIVKVRETV